LGLKESALAARATFTPVNGSPALPQGDSAVGYLNQSIVKVLPCPDEMHFSDLTFCLTAIIARQHNLPRHLRHHAHSSGEVPAKKGDSRNISQRGKARGMLPAPSRNVLAIVERSPK
jgi:hypothetical protein